MLSSNCLIIKKSQHYDPTDLQFPAINKMIQHLSRWKLRAADVEEDEDPVSTPTLPYLTVGRFKALVLTTVSFVAKPQTLLSLTNMQSRAFSIG